MKRFFPLLLLTLAGLTRLPGQSPSIDYAQRPQNQICTRLIIDEFKCSNCSTFDESLLVEIRTDIEEILDKYQHCDILSRAELPRVMQMLENENSLSELNADDRAALLAKADRILFGTFIIQANNSGLLSLKIVRLSDARIEGTKRIELPSNQMNIYSERVIVMEQKIAEMLLGGTASSTAGTAGPSTPPPSTGGDENTPPPVVTTPRRVSLSMLNYLQGSRWSSGKILADGHNTNPSYALSYPGTPDAKGHVQLVSGTLLEDNSAPQCLHMHPSWVEQGTIKGHLSYIEALPDRAVFSARVGFIKPQGTPGTDGVRFWVWVHYTENGRPKWVPVVNEYKTYTGALKTVYADLSQFSGQRISIELRVDAGASSGQDWAVWVDPKIEGYQEGARSKQ